MIYLSGAVHASFARQPDTGWMFTPNMGNRPDLSGTLWAADTGCFTKPDEFNATKYLGWLAARRKDRARCLFATAPDRVGDAIGTLEVSAPILPQIRDLGFRAALVAQDGLESMDIPWGSFDCLFIGGSTSWKLSEAAFRLALDAESHGKWVHMGRVNSWKRLKACAVGGFDSADGTFVAFGPDINAPKVHGWIETLRRSPAMDVER